jgi:hypothetical protein
MESIYNVSLDTNAGGDFYLLLSDFLDAFYRTAQELRSELIREEPMDMDRPEYVPFLASTAHKLANDYGLEPPRWAFEKRCYLPGTRPHFACGALGSLRLLFMYKSPSEFKHRNLFVDENVLTRV